MEQTGVKDEGGGDPRQIPRRAGENARSSG